MNPLNFMDKPVTSIEKAAAEEKNAVTEETEGAIQQSSEKKDVTPKQETEEKPGGKEDGTKDKTDGKDDGSMKDSGK